MARVPTETRPADHGHAVGQARRDLRDAHAARSGGGDLERQRQSVELAAQIDDRGDLVIADGDPELVTPDEKQFDGGTNPWIEVGGRRQRQRSHGDERFARQLERRSAGGEHRGLLAGGQHPEDRVRRGVEEVLTVVDHQQHGPIDR